MLTYEGFSVWLIDTDGEIVPHAEVVVTKTGGVTYVTATLPYSQEGKYRVGWSWTRTKSEVGEKSAHDSNINVVVAVSRGHCAFQTAARCQCSLNRGASSKRSSSEQGLGLLKYEPGFESGIDAPFSRSPLRFLKHGNGTQIGRIRVQITNGHTDKSLLHFMFGFLGSSSTAHVSPRDLRARGGSTTHEKAPQPRIYPRVKANRRKQRSVPVVQVPPRVNAREGATAGPLHFEDEEWDRNMMKYRSLQAERDTMQKTTARLRERLRELIHQQEEENARIRKSISAYRSDIKSAKTRLCE